MSSNWEIVNNSNSEGASYYYIGNESVLREIFSYVNEDGKVVFTVECGYKNNQQETDDLIQKVQRLFKESIHKILSTESRFEQSKNGDIRAKFYIEDSIALKEPEIEISRGVDTYNKKNIKLEFETYARRYIGIFINTLDIVFDLGETAEKLFSSNNVNPICSNFLSLKALVDNGRFEDAIREAEESAKCPRYANIQIELAQYLEETDRGDLAYNIYNSFDEDHPLFETVQEKIFNIIQNNKTAEDMKLVSMTAQEKNDLLIAELDAMMNLPIEQQSIIDRRINQLCGEGLTLKLTNIRYNADTILSFCEHIKRLNEKIVKLESDR